LDANNPSTLASQSELSKDEDAIPMDENDRTESMATPQQMPTVLM
jgi:hypothetical protein